MLGPGAHGLTQAIRVGLAAREELEKPAQLVEIAYLWKA